MLASTTNELLVGSGRSATAAVLSSHAVQSDLTMRHAMAMLSDENHLHAGQNFLSVQTLRQACRLQCKVADQPYCTLSWAKARNLGKALQVSLISEKSTCKAWRARRSATRL